MVLIVTNRHVFRTISARIDLTNCLRDAHVVREQRPDREQRTRDTLLARLQVIGGRIAIRRDINRQIGLTFSTKYPEKLS